LRWQLIPELDFLLGRAFVSPDISFSLSDGRAIDGARRNETLPPYGGKVA